MESPEITIDFKPSQSADRLIAKLGTAKRNLLAEATKRWKLGEAARAIIASRFPWEALATPERVARRSEAVSGRVACPPSALPRPSHQPAASAGASSTRP